MEPTMTRMGGTMDYERAVKEAATRQGLDPAVSALRDAGIPVRLDQTGGFVMVAVVDTLGPCHRFPGLWAITITKDEGTTYLVGVQSRETWENADGTDEEDVRMYHAEGTHALVTLVKALVTADQW